MENRLHSVAGEQYLYDENGIRIKKTVGATTTLYPFGHYEVSGTTVKKYYTFGGMTIAMRTGSTLQYLHTDHLGGVAAVTTSAGAYSTNQSYFAYGKKRAGGTLPTTINYTGQRLDGSGLVYMNARYYDPLVGMFISPDTIVPDASVLIDYNRFAYARGNSLKYNDPSGHCPTCFIGGFAGGLLTSGTYLATTSYAQWNLTDFGVVTGAGAVGGALIGTGIGITAGTASMSAAMTLATSAAVAGGAGALISSESYMIANSVTSNTFDRSDFVITTAAGGLEGAAAATIPGSGLVPGLTRSALSGGFGVGEYGLMQMVNGQEISAGEMVSAGGVAAFSGFAGDLFAGGFTSPSPLILRNPQTVRDFVPTVFLDLSLNSRGIQQAVNEQTHNVVRPIIRNVGIDVFSTMLAE